MRIHTRPSRIDFLSGEPTEFAVSVVGKAPHKTFYVEEQVAYVQGREQGPEAVGQLIARDMLQQRFQELAEEHGVQQAQQMVRGNIELNIPQIPGVTAPGEWQNPRFGNPERHRQLYGMKTRTPEIEREVIGNPERFTA